MSVPSQSALASFAIQADGKVGRGNTFDPSGETWWKIKALNATLGPVEDQQVFPPEVGGTIVPTGAYKQALYFAGALDLIPRLENTLGVLLLGALGNASFAANVPAASVNRHTFRFDPASSYRLPWMAFRRLIPGEVSSDNYGEIGYDCRVATLRVAMPAMGKPTVSVGFQGRDSLWETGSAWNYGNALFEQHLSTVDSGEGTFSIGGVEYPILGATFEFSNGLTDPRSEMILGDYRPDDFVPLFRSASIRFVYKYVDPDLCNQIYTGSTTVGDAWTRVPFVRDTVGSTPAFEATFLSVGNIPSTATPYRLSIRANRIVLAPDGPMQLQGGSIVTQAFTAMILEPGGANEEYVTIDVDNAEGRYSLLLTGGGAPVITMQAAEDYSVGGGAEVPLDAAATLTDADSANFDGGLLKVAFTAGTPSIHADDTLFIDAPAGAGAGAISLVGSQVRYDSPAVVIGTASGGFDGVPLRVHLNQNATPTNVTELLQVLAYVRNPTAPTGTVGHTVTVQVEMNDGDGGNNTDTIVITHIA